MNDVGQLLAGIGLMISSAGAFAIIMIIFFYFLPTIVAFLRSKRNGAAIMALNILLGWTLIGWAIAMVWSLTSDERVERF
jgi:hypothetical protein